MAQEERSFFILTYEELERFDHMVTAMMQAYWALVTHRPISVPHVSDQSKIDSATDRFHQLHFELNDSLED